MDLRDRLRMEVVIRRLAVTRAYERLKKEEKEATKERRQVPRGLREELQRDIADATGNVESVVAALEAASRFPPLAWRP